MKYVEYGTENKDVILLLHGGGLSWWNFREGAELLQSDYHVILPVLDGHSGSDRNFTTIEDNAGEIISFIDDHFGGRVLLIGGVSLGAQILLEMLARRGDICRYAIVESALVIPSRLTHAMVRPAYGSCYGLIRKKWFAKLQFQFLRIKACLFEDYFRDTCAITKENMIAFLQANSLYSLKDSTVNCDAEVCVLIGDKEIPLMKKSAGEIHRKIPGSTLRILPGFHHGEFSLNQARHYVARILEMIEENE